MSDQTGLEMLAALIGIVLLPVVWFGVWALLPAQIAKEKGRNFWTWWFYGFWIFVAALPHALLLHPRGNETACRWCAAWMPKTARVCSSCTREVKEPEMSCGKRPEEVG